MEITMTTPFGTMSFETDLSCYLDINEKKYRISSAGELIEQEQGESEFIVDKEHPEYKK